MNEPRVLDQAFQDILQELELQQAHYFITGKAGTGKSTLLQLFRKTTHKKVVVLSPTGISALNVQGQTIHSFFLFPPKLLQPHDLYVNKRLISLMKAIETMIIDEISMVRADVMDAIDLSLRMHRRNNEPFGGVQMVLFGDLFQLPPVVSSAEEKVYFRTHYPSPYFFDSHVFTNGQSLQMIELSKVYRQRERGFIQLLDNIRTRQFDHEDLDALNERYQPESVIEEPYLTLCSTNAAAQAINQEKLAQLQTPSWFYSGMVSGDFNPKLFPTEYKLELREQCQVMLLRNDPERRFVNGTLARVIALEEEKVYIRMTKPDGTEEEIELPKMTWEINKYSLAVDDSQPIKTEVAGSFTQYPVRLAWAVTIHKSQGMTYDRVAIDLGKGAFEHGQSYVALSRCRSFHGVFLKRQLTPRDILVDERVVEFYEMMR